MLSPFGFYFKKGFFFWEIENFFFLSGIPNKNPLRKNLLGNQKNKKKKNPLFFSKKQKISPQFFFFLFKSPLNISPKTKFGVF